MSSEVLVSRYRLLLFGLSALTLVGALVELTLIGHTKETLQWLPFVLSGIGLIVVIFALLRPGRGVLLALDGIMAVVLVGGLLGMLIHVQRNLAFEMEVHPGVQGASLLLTALGGASPLLAPGMLSLAAILALAAAYQHPALRPVGPIRRPVVEM